jgi:fructosamine-3-kinase
MFEREAEGLALLNTSQGPRVPQVYGYGRDERGSYLILEYLKPSSKHSSFWHSFGASLAALHLCGSTDQPFGLAQSNYIGSTPQPNVCASSWVEFFAEYRLEYQLGLAEKKGVIDADTVRLIGRVIERLDTLLYEPPVSLVHGDLWSGNMVVGPQGEAVIIDPAVYYGHNEVDLAMTELFGGFDEAFYRGYAEVIPPVEGYARRRSIYNLYHMLNHLNLFGGGYLAGVRELATAALS